MINLLTLVLIFMIIGAIISIWTTDLLSAIIAVGAVGFGSSVVFLLLRAPDVALAPVVVEVLMLVILIRATVGRDVHTIGSAREIFGLSVAAVLVLLLLAFAVHAIGGLPEFGEPVMARVADAPASYYLENGLSQTGSANIVTAVLLDFRGYDTLGEATVLFGAILGAMTLLRRKSRTDKPRQE